MVSSLNRRLAVACLLITSVVHCQTNGLKKEIQQEIMAMQKAYHVQGLSVAVVEDNHTILCEGFGLSNIDKHIPFQAGTVGRLASATKFFTSLGILAAVQRGIIDLDKPLKEYITDVPPDWQDIPLWRLLNLTSGIPGTEKTFFDKMPENEQRGVTEHDLFNMLHTLPLDYRPGEKWSYRQTGYMIVAMIISDKTGKSWPEYLKETVLQPAGTKNTEHNDIAKYPPDFVPKNYIHDNDNNKWVNAPFFFPLVLSTGAGYNTTAADLAKIFLAINSNKVLSPEFISKNEFNWKWMYPLEDSQYYSIASEIKIFGPYLTTGHSGGPDIANIRYAPGKKVGVAVLANRNNTGICEQLTNRILKRILLDSAFSVQSEPVGYAVRQVAAKNDYEGLLKFYNAAKSDPKYTFNNEENDLNNAGYEFLNESHITVAINILRLLVAEYPNSANAYDSLGEAYLKSGNKKLALLNYKRSLELDPNNDNARKIIQQLQTE